MTKENNSTSFWKIASAAGLGTLVVLGASALFLPSQPTVDVSKLNSAILDVQDAAVSVQTAVNDLNKVNNSVDNTATITTIHDKLFEADAWEAEADVFAQEELEHRNYRDLFNWMTANNYSITDKEDIDRVTIKETDFSNMDVDDKDGTVTHEVRVYYEDSVGIDKRADVKVVTTILDGEVDDQVYSIL